MGGMSGLVALLGAMLVCGFFFSFLLFSSNQSSPENPRPTSVSPSAQSSFFQYAAGPSYSHSQSISQSQSPVYHQQQQHRAGLGILGMPKATNSLADSLSLTQSMMEDDESRSIKWVERFLFLGLYFVLSRYFICLFFLGSAFLSCPVLSCHVTFSLSFCFVTASAFVLLSSRLLVLLALLLGVCFHTVSHLTISDTADLCILFKALIFISVYFCWSLFKITAVCFGLGWSGLWLRYLAMTDWVRLGLLDRGSGWLACIARVRSGLPLLIHRSTFFDSTCDFGRVFFLVFAFSVPRG